MNAAGYTIIGFTAGLTAVITAVSILRRKSHWPAQCRAMSRADHQRWLNHESTDRQIMDWLTEISRTRATATRSTQILTWPSVDPADLLTTPNGDGEHLLTWSAGQPHA